MLKKHRKLASLSVVALVLLFILVGFPLPQNMGKALWGAKLNNLLPGHSLEFKETRFLLLNGFRAKAFDVSNENKIVLSLERLQVRHSIPFMFTGRGRLKLNSNKLIIQNFPSSAKVLKFLSNTLNCPLTEDLEFKETSCGLGIYKRKIVLNYLELEGEDLKITASGYLERDKKIDFLVDIFISDKLAGGMSEEGRMLLFGPETNGFNKISLKIYGSPTDPSYSIRANFLELNIS